MRASCVLFPGQGFQKFGILANLASKHAKLVDPILEKCDEALPQLALSRLLLGTGEPVDVTPTEVAQPLLLAHGYAHYEVWKQTVAVPSSVNVQFGMGHSLGEYTAFTAAGLLPLVDALNLVRSRGEAMRDASSQHEGDTGMTMFMTPRGMQQDEWLQLLEQSRTGKDVDIAAFNSPSQTVVSGSQPAIDDLIAEIKASLAQSKSRLIAKPLPVSGAFHSRYMQAASEKLQELVSKANWQPIESAKFSVISNVTGLPYSSLDEIKRCCLSGLVSPVQWLQSVRYLEKEGVDSFVAMGSDIHKLMEKDLAKDSASSVYK